MQDFRKNWRRCETFTNITLDEFQKLYTAFSLSTDKTPTASNIFSILDSNGMTTGKFNVVIFFESPNPPGSDSYQGVQPVIAPPPLMMNL